MLRDRYLLLLQGSGGAKRLYHYGSLRGMPTLRFIY